ncbi:MAG: ribosome small subunit-dependent GTPase A [Leeuwenhoekiella sp.]
MKGTVYKSTGSWYLVKNADHGFIECRIKGRLRLKGIKSTNPVAVGDVVEYELESTGDQTTGVIKSIAERENYIIRKSVNLSKQTHILAANIDIAFLVITLNNPPTFTSFIDRFLVTCEAYHIKAVLLFNKMDVYGREEEEEILYLKTMYMQIGYECLDISAMNGHNIDAVKHMMLDKTTMFSGHSGVGKSTLVNAIAPDLNLKTKAISDQHMQGQHTTTFAEMYDLDFGARIIDTPGIKGFGIVDIDTTELGDYFPEFFERKSQCKFNNCLHVQEPNCEVKEALEEGRLFWSRYESYLQMLNGEDDNYRRDAHKLD